MKAIQITKPGKLEIVDREKPEQLGRTQVLVKTKVVGICHSDVLIYKGLSPFATYPRIIGHEAVGEVEKVGGSVKTLKPGDRVVLEPIEYCGECYACRGQQQNVCEKLQVAGVMSDGGFAEYFVADESKLHKFPDTLAYEGAVMIEPFTIGAQICARGEVREGDVVLIIGAGPTGLSALENALALGAVCIVSDVLESRLKLAKEFGASHVINPKKQDIKAELEKITDGMMANVVVDAAGSPQTMEQGIALTSVAGRVVCVGFTDNKVCIPMVDITKKELKIVGTRLQSFKFKSSVEYFSKGKVNTTKLITHILPYTEAQQAMDLCLAKDERVGKVILKFDD